MNFLDGSLFPENQDKLVITAAPYGPEWMPSDFPEDIPVTMEAQVDTAETGQSPRLEVRAVGSRRFVVRGRLPVGHRPVVRIYEVEEPASFARSPLPNIVSWNGNGGRALASRRRS